MPVTEDATYVLSHDDVIKWGNSPGPGPGEFPAQRPVTGSFDVFVDLRLNKRLSKQPWGWWFETPSWSLWRQFNVLLLAETTFIWYVARRALWSHMLSSKWHVMFHDDVIKWKHIPRYWPFVRGIHRSPVNSPHKGQWRGALKFSLICAWITGWVYNREAGDFKRYRAHYHVTVMSCRVSLYALTPHNTFLSAIYRYAYCLTLPR